MTKKIETLTIEGIEYVPNDSIQTFAENIDNMPLVLIRGYGSGVQYGYLKEQNGCMVTLINSRHIWSWTKATECSQIAVNGVGRDSKITVEVPEKTITDAIEIIKITKQGADNLLKQPIWSK